MNLDLEYAIKQDIRNNPVVRDVDQAQRREFLRTLVVGGLVVLMLLLSIWPHFLIVSSSYEVEAMRDELAAARELNRQLRLEYEMWQAPHRLEARAKGELRMVAPGPDDIVVLERAPVPAAPRGVMAGAR